MSPKRRIGVLLICSLSVFIGVLDVTAVNVALPSIAAEMNAEISELQWVVNAFTLAYASLLMFSGSLGDRFGRRRVLIAGFAVFSLGSLLSGLASSVGLLVGFRFLQGVGASALSPVAMSIITTSFADHRGRARAVGVWTAVIGTSIAIGPLVGGALVSAVGWRAVFLVNIPVGLAAIGLILRFVPESRAARPHRFDPVGQLLMTAMLTALIFGIIEAPDAGLSSPLALGALSAAGAALLALLLYEPRRREPLIDPRFFRSIPFSTAIVISTISWATFGGFLFLNTLFLQEVRGLSPLQAGLATAPLALAIVVASPLSGRIVGLRGPRFPFVAGGVCLAAACAMLVELDASTPLAWMVVAYGLLGTGIGLVNIPITVRAVAGLPPAQAGVAAAIATTSRQVGQMLGVAIVGAIVTSHLRDAAVASLANASGPAWWTLCVGGGIVAMLGFFATGQRAQASAQHVAAELNLDAAGK